MVEACKLQAPSSWADAYVTAASHRPSKFSRFAVHTSHCLELARVASWSWSGDLKTKWVGKKSLGYSTCELRTQVHGVWTPCAGAVYLHPERYRDLRARPDSTLLQTMKDVYMYTGSGFSQTDQWESRSICPRPRSFPGPWFSELRTGELLELSHLCDGN